MSLSNSEKMYIIDILDRMDDAEKNKVLSSESSFGNWLQRAVDWLFDKITSWGISQLLNALWNWFRN